MLSLSLRVSAAFPVNFRWYQHVLALFEDPDGLLPDRPFREANLERDVVLLPEHKGQNASGNLETGAVDAGTVWCNEST